MIYTSSVLKGYQATLSYFPLRLAFLFAMFIVVPIPTEYWEKENVISKEPELSLQDHGESPQKFEDLKDMTRVWIMQFVVHLLCAFNSLAYPFIGKIETLEMWLALIQIVTVLLMIWVFLEECHTLLVMRDEIANPAFDQRPKDVQTFQVWITLEISLIFAITFSNFIFLLIRNFKKNIVFIVPDYY